MTEFFDKLSAVKLGELSLGTLLSSLIVFLICYVAIRLLSRASKRLLEKNRIDASLKSFLSSAIKAVLWIIAALITADSLGIPVTSLVALVSVVGLALSLSIQGLLSNLFSGITLLVTRPFVVGDYIELGGDSSGTVKSIGLFYTVLTTPDNKVIHVPNGDITAAKIENYSSEELRRVDMSFGADYSCPTDAVFSALLEAAKADERILIEPAPFVGISDYASSDIKYCLRVWCKNADYWSVRFGLNEAVRSSFEKHGIIMSYEHLEVHINSDENT